MRNRFGITVGVLFAATQLFWIIAPAAAQTASGKTFKIPRMADGHPNLEGIYDLATITPVERPAGVKAALTKEEATKDEAARAKQRADRDRPIDGNRAAPPKGGRVGGYNAGWLDPGSTYTVVDGQKRTSLVIDPPDGRIPPFTAEAQARGAGRGRLTADAPESNDPGLDPTPGAYDDPERRPLGERCILGFGSTSGPPALPDYFYNNLHQIVQTPDTIVIQSEMVHDARIIRMNAQHLPTSFRRWMGDSVGHWEGDTLVIDTTNFTDKTRFRGSTENLHVVERLTRVDDRSLLYRFTVEDPQTWARPWTGEYTWPATGAPIYEYACHEANYALGDILRGARERDRESATKP